MAWGIQRFDGVCGSCGKAMDREGTSCRSCLTRQLAQGSAFVMVAALGLFGLYYTNQMHHAANAAVVSDPVDIQAVEAAKARAHQQQNAAGGWIYFDTEDRVVGDVAHHARLIGRRAPLAPPGAASPAPQPGAAAAPAVAEPRASMLELTASAHYGKHVIITLPRIEKPCDPAPCVLSVSFDEAPPETFTYQDVSDGDATVLMSSEFTRFLEPLRKAHDVTLVLVPAVLPGDPSPTPHGTAMFISDGLKGAVVQ